MLVHKGFKELWLPASTQTNGFLFLADKGAGIHKLAHTGIQICLHTAHTQRMQVRTNRYKKQGLPNEILFQIED